MPTEIALVATSLFNRQDGVASASTGNKSSSALPAATGTDGAAPSGQVSAVDSTNQTAGVADRQALAVREQDLPAESAPNDEASLKKAVSDISNYVQTLQRDLQFEVDTDLGRTVISVVDSKTQEVIRQIPSEEVLARARFLQEQESNNGASDGLLLRVQI